MPQSSYTHFKVLAVNPARFLSVSDNFGRLCMKGLNTKHKCYTFSGVCPRTHHDFRFCIQE